jgi:hypothetical protein
MTTVGEVRESDHIDCMDWSLKIRLQARRLGTNEWSIWRSNDGQTVATPELETKYVDLPNTYWPNVRVFWDGSGFQMTREDGSIFKLTQILRYIGHDMREQWECHWMPEKNLFHHVCIRIA